MHQLAHHLRHLALKYCPAAADAQYAEFWAHCRRHSSGATAATIVGTARFYRAVHTGTLVSCDELTLHMLHTATGHAGMRRAF
jgi:hypothetical protein